MCGIAGFVTDRLFAKGNPQILGEMLERIAHRGPDSSGTWHENEINLGHRRLAVVDISPTGAQPMFSANGRYVISYNGEIYNGPELRDWLDARNAVKWRGTSDTEILVELIAHVGFEPALQRANGMFAIALWDRNEKAMYLAVDRFGEKPLYYTLCAGSLFFASELIALEAVDEIPKIISRHNAANFMRRGNIPAPTTIYENVWKLPPATWRCYKNGKISDTGTYWSIQEVAKRGFANPISDHQTVDDQLEFLLMKSCKEKMAADVPLGAFLSGGIDSSLVVALMQMNSSRPIKTFTIGFDIPVYNEAPYARAIAERLQTDHTEQIITASDALAVVPRLCEIYGEPFADASAIPAFLVSKLARHHVTVSLSGDGGDELFGGYDRYIAYPQIWSLLKHLPGRRQLASIMAHTPKAALLLLSPLAKLMNGRTGSRGISIASKIHRFAEVMETESFQSFYRSLMKAGKTNHLIQGSGPIETETETYDSLFFDQSAWMSFCDTVDYLPNDILTKMDRAAMASSLEGRMPLLDPELFAFAWRIPQKDKIAGQVGKVPLRRVLAKYLPVEFFDRPKMGFGVPLAHWLRGPLKAWSMDLLSASVDDNRKFFNPKAVRLLGQSFFSGNDALVLPLWHLLMLQSWLMDRKHLIS